MALLSSMLCMFSAMMACLGLNIDNRWLVLSDCVLAEESPKPTEESIMYVVSNTPSIPTDIINSCHHSGEKVIV
jgi:hypothetical protein